jgi:hypothetical protein
MKRHILLYGVAGGLLIVVLKMMEYRFLVVEHSIEIYGGLVAALFSAIGIWLGLKLTRPKETVVIREVTVPSSEPFTLNQQKLDELAITPRELEILELIAKGMSNREIAENFSSARIPSRRIPAGCSIKLGAKRRTQAAQMGKELGLIP